MAIQFNTLQGAAKSNRTNYMKLVDGINTFRILPNSILPGYTYWLQNPATGKNQPFECLQFVRETEQFDNMLPDPVSDRNLKNDKGEPMRCQWSYRCQVINAATQKVEVLQLKKGMLGEIISVAKQLQVDPTDLETGFWVNVDRKKTGPLAFNVEYTVQQLLCKSEPLEQRYQHLALDIPDIEELFPLETVEAQRARLSKLLDSAPRAGSDGEREAVRELS